MAELPYFSGREELTAAQVNALIDQLRRQSRLRAAPPLEAVQQAEGWTLRLAEREGHFAILDGPDGGAGLARYAYREAFPASDGTWEAVPAGRVAPEGGGMGAEEANGLAGVPAGTVAWLEPPALPGEPWTFQAPASEAAAVPLFYWAALDGESGGTYGYAEAALGADGTFRAKEAGRQAEAGTSMAAVEANGTAGIPSGTVVLMLHALGPDAEGEPQDAPMFAFGSGGGFWARLGRAWFPASAAVSLAEPAGGEGEGEAPTGGTWVLSATASPLGPVLSASATLGAAASALEVQEALEGMDFILWGNVLVEGDAGGPWTVRWQGELLEDPPTLAVDGSGLEYAAGDPAGRQSVTASGGYEAAWDGPAGSGFVELSQSASGTWYEARTPRRGHPDADWAFPAWGGEAADAADVVEGSRVFLEPARDAGTPPAGTLPMGLALDGAGLSGGSAFLLPSESESGTAAELSSTATAGTFVLSVGGTDAEPLAFDATAEDVQEAIRAVDGAPEAECTGGPLPGASILIAPPEGHEDEDGSPAAWAYSYSSPPGGWSATGGVAGAAVLSASAASGDELHVLELYRPGEGGRGRPTSGTFTLSMGEEETGEIAFDAAWQDVVDELEKLSAVGPGNVTASGGPLPAPVLLSFTGDLAGRAVEPATADSTGLSADEGEARADVYRVPQADVSLSGLSPATGDVNVRLSLAGEETAAFDASATSGAAAALLLCGLDGAGPYRVTGTGPAGGPWTFRFWHGLGGPDADAPELEVLPQDTTPPSGPPAASQIEATADIGDSRGYALEASGTMRLSFGAQYRLDPPATGTGTFTVRVNGTTVLTATAGAPLLPAVHTLAVPLSSGTGGGRMAAWGRPGSRSVWLAFLDWPAGEARAVTSSSSVSAPASSARIGTTYRGEWGGAAHLEVAACGTVTGGTWRFARLYFCDPTTAAYTNAPALPWNATAADVQAVLDGYRFRLAQRANVSSPWATLDHYPFLGVATASGGPLPGTPIAITISTEHGTALRDYSWSAAVSVSIDTGLNISNPYALGTNGEAVSGVPPSGWALTFLPDGRGLTAPAFDPAVTVTRLDSEEVPLPATAQDIQDALNATANGAGVVVEGPDGGPWTISCPAHAASAFGGDSGPFDVPLVSEHEMDAGTLSLPLPPGDADGLLGGPAAGVPAGLRPAPPAGDAFRTEADGTPQVPRRTGFWARVFGPPTSDGYHWAEANPGAGRVPRVSGLAGGRSDGTPAIRLAREASANPLVPHGSLAWIEHGSDASSDGVVYAFSHAPRLEAVPALLAGPWAVTGWYDNPQAGDFDFVNTGYAGGGSCAAAAVAGTYAPYAWGGSAAWGNALAWAGPEQEPLASHDGLLSAEARPAYTGSFFLAGGMSPALARTGDAWPALRAWDGTAVGDWLVPVSAPVAVRGEAGALLGTGKVYGEAPLADDYGGTWYNQMGDGHKAVSGGLFLWESGTFPAGGSVGTGGGSVLGYSSYLGTIGGTTFSPSVFFSTSYDSREEYGFFPGRSETQSFTPAFGATTATLTWSGYGTTASFAPFSVSRNRFQQLLEAVFGVGNVYVADNATSSSSTRTWAFKGALGRMDMPTPTVTPGAAGTVSTVTAGLTPAANCTGGFCFYEIGPLWPPALMPLNTQWATAYLTAGYTQSLFFVTGTPAVLHGTACVARWRGGGGFGLIDDAGGWTGVGLGAGPTVYPARKRFWVAAQGLRHAGGKGISALVRTHAGGDAVGLGSLSPYGGVYLAFWGGLLVDRRVGTTVGLTTTFATRDGRTATLVNGYVTSVA